TSTTTTEQSLEALLDELVANADDWAALKTDSLLESPASPSSADGQHPCFDQLSRAISSHVTDLLMRRLRLAKDEEEENEDTDDEDRPWIDERGRERRGRGFAAASLAQPPESLRGSAGSLSSRDSPNSSSASGGRGGAAPTAPPPVVRGRGRAATRDAHQPPSTAVSRAGSTCSLTTIERRLASRRHSRNIIFQTLQGSRYHSENRLDRAYPSPRPGETPLENRASRLRRMSIERRQAERNPRRRCRSAAR
ncbi:hypothetical protein PMAYCL1PPCAC_20143, partial [Pristionchus mayeri]